MEKKNFLSFRNIFICAYAISFFVYLLIGFMPAEAINSSFSSLIIPAINLSSQVIESKLIDGNLDVPDTIVGSFSKNANKTLLIGHASSVFNLLPHVKLKDKIIFNDSIYTVVSRVITPKNTINMNYLLSQEDDNTIILMTCAGTSLPNRDASHRLILTAKVE